MDSSALAIGGRSTPQIRVEQREAPDKNRTCARGLGSCLQLARNSCICAAFAWALRGVRQCSRQCRS